MRNYKRLGKPVLDYLGSLLLLCLLMPLNIAIALAISISMGRPILFCQERIGHRKKLFKIYKYRTMNDRRDCNGNILPDKFRVTKIGLFLRRFGLDELPELFNILKGDMSIVGPRPLLPKYLPCFKEDELKRFDIKPGITGLAQVLGRNELSWDERFRYDIYYVDNCSLFLDIKTIIITIWIIISGDGFQKNPESFMKNLDEERSKNITKEHSF